MHPSRRDPQIHHAVGAHRSGVRPDSAVRSPSRAQFLAWTEARRWFDERVVIIQGDSARAVEQDLVWDAHAFDDVLSDVYLRKKGVRARHTEDLSGRSAADAEPEVRVQPPLAHGARHSFAIRGRSTRVRSLIHYVRPSASALLTSWRALSRSFTAAMAAIQTEQLRSVAVLAAPHPAASTAAEGSVASVHDAAYEGLRELQQFVLREATWRGTVGVVCYDKETFRAFSAQKERVLARFGVGMESH